MDERKVASDQLVASCVVCVFRSIWAAVLGVIRARVPVDLGAGRSEATGSVRCSERSDGVKAHAEG